MIKVRTLLETDTLDIRIGIHYTWIPGSKGNDDTGILGTNGRAECWEWDVEGDDSIIITSYAAYILYGVE